MTRATTFRATAIVGGFLLAILMIMTVSRAAFTDTTSNAGNSWESGTVQLTDDWQTHGAMFLKTDLTPGDKGFKCIEVIYTGSVSADVVLSSISTAGSNGLAPALMIKIDRYDTACPDTGSGVGGVFDGTLAEANGAVFNDTWEAPTDASSQFYEISWEFDPAPGTDNNYQGKKAMAAFTWQATSK